MEIIISYGSIQNELHFSHPQQENPAFINLRVIIIYYDILDDYYLLQSIGRSIPGFDPYLWPLLAAC